MSYRYVPRYILEQEKEAQLISLSAQVHELRYTEESYQKLNLQYQILNQNYNIVKNEKENEEAQLIRRFETAEYELTKLVEQKKKVNETLRQKQKEQSLLKIEKRELEAVVTKNQGHISNLQKQKNILIQKSKINNTEKQLLEVQKQKLSQNITRIETQRNKKRIDIQNESLKIKQTQKYLSILTKDQDNLKQKLLFFQQQNTRLDTSNQELYQRETSLKFNIKSTLQEKTTLDQKIQEKYISIEKISDKVQYSKNLLNREKDKQYQLTQTLNHAKHYYDQKYSIWRFIQGQNQKLEAENRYLQIQNDKKTKRLKDLEKHIENLIQMNSLLVGEMKNCRVQDYTVKSILDDKSRFKGYPSFVQSPSNQSRIHNQLKQISQNELQLKQTSSSKFAESRSTMSGSRIRHQISL